MKLLAKLAVAIVALLHFGFLVLEAFLWTTDRAMKATGLTPEQAAATVDLGRNIGLYNGFLAAGLVWGLLSGRRDVKLFFLGFIVIAGIVGGMTASPTIYLVQAAPAAIALVLVLLADRKA